LAYSPLRKSASAMAGEIRGPTRGPPGPFKPALISIRDALYYLGGLSRSKFYTDVLPLVDTVKIGKRNFVTTDSLDRLIAANQRSAQSQARRPEIGRHACGVTLVGQSRPRVRRAPHLGAGQVVSLGTTPR
jgi:hypothetical protein